MLYEYTASGVDLTIGAGGSATAEDATTMTNPVVQSGGEFTLFGTFVVLAGAVISGGGKVVVNGFHLSNSQITTLGDGAVISVTDGGHTNALTLQSGTVETAFAGTQVQERAGRRRRHPRPVGHASALGAQISSGGTLDVIGTGSFIVGTTVFSGGLLEVGAGYTLDGSSLPDITFSAGSLLQVDA